MTGFLAALTLQAGYNAALVAVGAGLLGLAAGAVGAFLLMRRRALLPDAMAHATLPGVALAFMVMVALGGTGRSLPGLMLGGAVTAALGALAVGWLTLRGRLQPDAAIGAVLSVFFGAGLVLLTLVQGMAAGQQAGLESLLLGATAGMLRADVLAIAATAVAVCAGLWVLRRPLVILAFDPGHAAALGLRARLLDTALMALVLAVTVAGMRITGVVLVLSLLLSPAVAARFWTQGAGAMVALAAAFGAGAGWTGAALSASAPNLPAGPVIALTATALVAVSFAIAPARGLAGRMLRRRGA